MFYHKNEKLTSVSFTELIQTLRTNPQIASLIYSIPTANNVNKTKIIVITLPNALNLIRIVYEVLPKRITKIL